MSELRPADFGEPPTLEVRVYRDGVLLQRELCESEADAAAVVEAWEEEPGIECEVDDLAAPRHDVEVLEIERDDVDEHPTVPETGARTEPRW